MDSSQIIHTAPLQDIQHIVEQDIPDATKKILEEMSTPLNKHIKTTIETITSSSSLAPTSQEILPKCGNLDLPITSFMQINIANMENPMIILTNRLGSTDPNDLLMDTTQLSYWNALTNPDLFLNNNP
ncbi:hypothetical protein F8M41_016377 [Gigaspora margarita]|uniref:Uncharacterized protein n=1 Tax=Gigaspora margarita TaxID=4874 RepID=A0A8H4APL3_GIGMA|nr:hypothetical protein F8M41_016377 [Gigaspora margarita]